MDISFIILNYKSEHYLANCIASIEKHASNLKREIIVVNNDAKKLQNDWYAETIQIINNKKNEGFSIACNKGAEIASGDVLFFLNPDTEIKIGNISQLITKLENNSTGIVAPQLLLPNGEVQPWSTGDEINLCNVLKNNISVFGKLQKNIDKTLTEVAWVSGAAFAIKKSTFEKVCGFDENFFMYFEDVDLCKRVAELGKKTLLLRDVKVLHIGGQSFSNTKRQKALYYASQDYYFKKHFGTSHTYVLRLLRSISLLFKV